MPAGTDVEAVDRASHVEAFLDLVGWENSVSGREVDLRDFGRWTE